MAASQEVANGGKYINEASTALGMAASSGGGSGPVILGTTLIRVISEEISQ
jgi:hypothetical protein